MVYLILADIVMVIHCAALIYIVLGELLILVGIPFGWQWIRNFPFRISHLAMILVVALESLLRVFCPLTILENLLLTAAGEEVERRSFAVRLLDGLLGLDISDENLNWPWVYGVLGGLIGLTYVFVPPSRKKRIAEKPTTGGGIPNDNRLAAVWRRFAQPGFLITVICCALAIGAAWYVYRWMRVEACEPGLEDRMTLSQKFAASPKTYGLYRQGTTVRKKLMELGAYCSDGVIYDWRGKKVVFCRIPETGVAPDERFERHWQAVQEYAEKLAQECTVIRMYEVERPY